MKKITKSVLLAASLLSMSAAGLTGCSNKPNSNLKVGLICLHGETSTYDKNFIDAFKAACDAKGVKAVMKTNIPEGQECYDAATDLVDQGCKYIFADSFGHESYLLKAAKENPSVQFSHATGTTAHTEKVSNFHNAFASIYEGRYLAGVAAGLKLKAMTEADANTSHTIGYVGAYTYAEVISGYTSYYLGVKSIVDDVTMKVQFTGSWYDEAAEKTAAETLISKGCSIISQHADSMGAPSACEAKGVPNVSYNGSTKSACPNTYLVSSKINWQPYFELAFDAVKNGSTIPTDYVGNLGSTLYDGSVALAEIGNAAVEGTEAKLNEVAGKLRDGSLKVFDCANFTVEGEHLNEYQADVDTDEAYAKDTQVIKTLGDKKYFAESEFRSAPYFDVQIDGIELLNTKF